MKIRKLQVKNYKMFGDLTLDFTDSDGNSSDVIVIAGINGTGKTSILQLLRRVFSESSNIFKVKEPLMGFESESNAIICDKIEVEIEISKDDISSLQNLISDSDSVLKKTRHISAISAISEIKKRLKHHIQQKKLHFNFSYILEQDTNGFIIRQNDFLLFGALPINKLSKIFKVIYFVANHSDLMRSKKNIRIIDGKMQDDEDYHYSSEPDGVVIPIDIFSQTKNIEDYIVESVKQSLIENRNQTGKEAIEHRITKINQLLQVTSLKTKLTDIDNSGPVFETFTGKKISSSGLSGGEKQLYYRAIMLDQISPKNSIIMIDEPENSLHPTWQSEVLKLYKNIGLNNHQVILVTHSPHIIASVDPKNLFLLDIDQNTKQIKFTNAASDGLHSKGVEPNRILKEIMSTPLRDFDTQKRIDSVADLLRLNPALIDEPENKSLIENLIADLGRQDPFVIRLTHQLNILKTRKL
ncbi:MAG: hypothetical protein BWK80_50305 [Desulfobacteraceae bacterium IS3]|nr:MAG: hypothetical protein BWK80_50305 [Desulfobacteraceae bacterium IS3]